MFNMLSQNCSQKYKCAFVNRPTLFHTTAPHFQITSNISTTHNTHHRAAPIAAPWRSRMYSRFLACKWLPESRACVTWGDGGKTGTTNNLTLLTLTGGGGAVAGVIYVSRLWSWRIVYETIEKGSLPALEFGPAWSSSVRRPFPQVPLLAWFELMYFAIQIQFLQIMQVEKHPEVRLPRWMQHHTSATGVSCTLSGNLYCFP